MVWCVVYGGKVHANSQQCATSPCDLMLERSDSEQTRAYDTRVVRKHVWTWLRLSVLCLCGPYPFGTFLSGPCLSGTCLSQACLSLPILGFICWDTVCLESARSLQVSVWRLSLCTLPAVNQCLQTLSVRTWCIQSFSLCLAVPVSV